MVFWLWTLPINTAILAGFILIYFAKDRGWTIFAIILQIAIVSLSYLPNNLISNKVRAAYGYQAQL